jgi:hypothetical protein
LRWNILYIIVSNVKQGIHIYACCCTPQSTGRGAHGRARHCR